MLYRVESWLFMSPLKCSNFFSVSSLKEPPEGWALGRQFGKSDAQPSPTLELWASGALEPLPSPRWPAGACSV